MADKKNNSFIEKGSANKNGTRGSKALALQVDGLPNLTIPLLTFNESTNCI
jgi:hypothetical protein